MFLGKSKLVSKFFIRKKDLVFIVLFLAGCGAFSPLYCGENIPHVTKNKIKSDLTKIKKLRQTTHSIILAPVEDCHYKSY